MLVPEKMDRVTAAVLRTDLDRVLNELATIGALHPAHVEEFHAWAKDLSTTDADLLRVEYEKRQARIAQLVETIHPSGSSLQPALQRSQAVIPLNVLDNEISRLEGDVAPLVTAQSRAVEKRKGLAAQAQQIEDLLPVGVPFAELAQSTFLFTAVGSISLSQLSNLRELLSRIPAVVYPFQSGQESARIACVVLKKDKEVLQHALRDCNFHEAVSYPDLASVTAAAQEEIGKEMAKIDSELAQIDQQFALARQETLPTLHALAHAVDDVLTTLSLKSCCRVSDKTCVLSGWTPKTKTAELFSALQDKTGGIAIVYAEDADELSQSQEETLDVPVLTKLPGFLKPFELLTDGYGVPAYRSLNPTLFVAVTFLLMFGMMFGDVGHGLVLACAGVFLWRRKTDLRPVAQLLVCCGATASVFGLLYGSVFGFETLIPTLWVKPLEHPTTLFSVAVTFGVAVISLGLLLNIANAIRCRTLLRDLFDVSGPLTLVSYWSAVGLFIKSYMSTQKDFSSTLLLCLVALPLIAFFAKGPVLAIAGVQDKAFPEGIIGYIMECAVKILEVLMGYLANTVSFIRVAAFGLAHAGLFVAIFSIAESLPAGPAGAVSSWLVLFFGNLVVIVLEGLVVTIQALRLEYYEFFGKFFSRMGTKYQPISFSKTVGKPAG
ncbi:MAG: hypothetical protein K1Y02_13210 [Candidatus Hydrogenedentes bacterium]|nr:hypothetical protein [Candidatus Hydrogenedentota bacterium]